MTLPVTNGPPPPPGQGQPPLASSPQGSSSYEPLMSCTWTLQAPAGSRVSGRFPQFEVEGMLKDGRSACFDAVELFDGADTNAPRLPLLRKGQPLQASAAPLCGSATLAPQRSDAQTPLPNDVFQSSGRTLTLRFTSDHTVEAQGWVFAFTSIP